MRGGAEYLPAETDWDALVVRIDAGTTYEVVAGDANVSSYSWDDCTLELDVDCTNASQIELPLLYYKGYQVISCAGSAPGTLEVPQVFAGTNGLLQLDIPAGYRGTIKIGFVSPVSWRTAELVSLVSVIALIIKLARDYLWDAGSSLRASRCEED